MLWCPMMFFNPQFPRLQQSGKFADSWVGFLGGILGGLGGFCGSLPSTWVMLKNLSKQEQRYILRHFNFGIQLFTLLAYLVQGTLEIQLLPYMLILLIFVSFPAILGIGIYTSLGT
jgi:hypothetical protein